MVSSHAGHVVVVHKEGVAEAALDQHVVVHVGEVITLHHHVRHVHHLAAVHGVHVLVEDHHVGHLHVVGEKVRHADLAVEGEAERQRVHAHGEAAHLAVAHGVHVNQVHQLVLDHGRHDHEHLHGHAPAAAHGQQHAVGEARARAVPPRLRHGVVSGAEGLNQRAVKHLPGPGPVADHVVHLHGVAHDGVLAGLELVDEAVDLDHVEPLVIDVHELAHAVVFGAEEHAHDGVHGLVGDDVDGELEVVVVEAALAGDHQHVGLLLLHLGLVQVEGVGDVHVHLVEEGNQLVGHEVLDLDSGEVELVAGVGGQQLLEQDHVVGHALHEHPEHGVAQAGLHHVEGGRDVRVTGNK